MALTLPPEEAYSEIELGWIELEPPGLFPMDQGSFWGQARKIFADHLQENIADGLEQIYRNLDPATADARGIAQWEALLGIPIDTTKSIENRRAFVQSRRERGPFTRARRRRVVEAFIKATFGPAPAFGLTGIPIGAGGIPLYSGEDSLDGTYIIIEDIPGFAYTVYLAPGVDVDDGLTRELERITTAPITFTLSSSWYEGIVLATGPRGYWRLSGNPLTKDYSGHGYTLTNTGTPTVNQTGLLVGDPDLAAAYDIGGSQSHTTVDVMALPTSAYSYECWAKPTAFPSSGQFMSPMSLGSSQNVRLTGTAGNVWSAQGKGGGGTVTITSAIAAVIGTIVHLVVTYDGATLKLYINGALVASGAMTGNAANSPGIVYVGDAGGSANEFAGTIDEAAVYDRALTAAEVLAHYNAGIGV